MVTALFTGLYEDDPCYYSGEYPKLHLNRIKYDDNCIKTGSGSEFRQEITSDDDLYNKILPSINEYDILYFNQTCYSQTFTCSNTTITFKNVIDRLIAAFPDKVALSQSCKPFPKPPNITAVSCTLSKETCVSPCTLTVTVVWKNDGGTAGKFTPAIKVGVDRISQPIITLYPGETITYNFIVNNRPVGSYNVCPDPN